MAESPVAARSGVVSAEGRLLIGLFCTYLGGSVTATASTMFLLQQFGFGVSSGVALALQLVPNLLLGPIAGEVVSRLNPKIAAMVGSLGAGIAVLGYLAVTEVWQAQLVSLVVGLAGVIGIPARMALRAAVLTPESLKSSTGAIVAAERLGLVLGPFVAAAVAAAIAVEAAFVVESVLALVAVAALSGLRPRPEDRAVPGGDGLRGIYGRAWRLLASDRIVWEYSLTGFTYSIGTGVRRFVFAAALVVTMSRSEYSLGVLVGAMALGGILGGLVAPRVRARSVDRQYVLQSVVEVALWAGLTLVVDLPLYVAIVFLAGIFEGSTTTLYFIRVQERLQPREIGRYFSLMSPMTDACVVIGILIASSLGAQRLADHGAWIIAAMIGVPFLVCRGIVRGALHPPAEPPESSDSDIEGARA